MRKHEIELFSFSELPPEAQQKAMEHLRDGAYENGIFLDDQRRLFEDELGNLNLKGFKAWGGAEGVGFDGSLEFEEILSINEITFDGSSAGEFNGLTTAIKKFKETVRDITGADKIGYLLVTFKAPHSGSGSQVTVLIEGADLEQDELDSMDSALGDSAKEFIAALEDVFELLADRLDDDYNSVEYWKEDADANDWEFTASGEMF